MEAPSAVFRRLHPLTFVHYVFLAIVGFVFAAVSAPDYGGDAQRYSLIFATFYATVTGPYAIAKYIRFRYHVTSDELLIYYGVFKRVRRNIPSERIHTVSIERNMLARILGTAAVKIETAGTGEAEGNLSYVGVREAERIRNLLRTAQTADPPESSTSPSFFMPLRRVLLSSIYQFSLGISALLVGVFFQLESFGIVDGRALTTWLVEQNFFSGTIEDFWPLLVVLFFLVTFALGWTLGFIQNLIRFYNFRIELGATKIRRRFGLITLHEGTLPYKRVQSFLIRSNPLMRLHGWHRLEMQTLGLQSGERGFQPGMPFAKWTEITALAPQIRPFTVPETYARVSRLTIRRRTLRYSLLIVLSSVIISLLWWPLALWGLCLLPAGWGLAWLQYLCHRWAYYDGNLLIRRRVFSQQFWIVPVERLQAFEITATFFQRRLGLCTLIVDTAGAGDLRYPRIIDLKREEANRLLAELYDAFQLEATW